MCKAPVKATLAGLASEVALPVTISDDSDSSSGVESLTSQEGAAPRILIVEDFDLTRSFLGNTLRYCRSAFCECVSSAEEALEVMARNGPYDVVLTDVIMDGMDGIEFVRKVREHERAWGWGEQVIICMSVDDSNNDACIAAGSSYFVFKYDEPMHKIFGVLDSVRNARNVGARVKAPVPAAMGRATVRSGSVPSGLALRSSSRSSSRSDHGKVRPPVVLRPATL